MLDKLNVAVQTELTDSFLRMVVKSYFREREDLSIPSDIEALLFFHSEVGELTDAFADEMGDWGRNDNKKVRSIEDEVGDVLMMLIVFCIQRGIDPVKAMIDKIKRKLENHIEGELK